MSEALNSFVRIWKRRREDILGEYHGVLITRPIYGRYGPVKTWRCRGEMKLYGCDNCSPSPYYCIYDKCGGRTDYEGTYCSSGCECEDTKYHKR